MNNLEQINTTYNSDIEFSVIFCKRVLQIVGIWPISKNLSSPLKCLITLFRIFCAVLLYFTLIPGLLKVFLEETNTRKKLKMVGPMCNCFMALSKYQIILFRQDKIRFCLDRMAEDWKWVKSEKDRNTMLETAKVGRLFMILCISFVYCSGFCYRIVIPATRGTIVTPNNVTIRPIPIPAYFIVLDPQKSPFYEILFSLQFIAGFVTYSCFGGVCSLAALFAMHSCGQLKILINRLNDIAQGERNEKETLEERLTLVVKTQVRNKNFITDVEDIFQHICLIEVIGCTLIICLLGYYVLMEWEDSDVTAMLTYFLLLMTFILNIFVYCLIGELLTDQGLKVATAASTLDWYLLPYKTAKSTILVIMYSNLGLKLTAGKFFVLSMSSFGTVMKTSAAYLNILRTTSI